MKVIVKLNFRFSKRKLRLLKIYRFYKVYNHMEPRKILIASFSPLPESVIEALFAPFSSEVNAKIEIIRLYDA